MADMQKSNKKLISAIVELENIDQYFVESPIITKNKLKIFNWLNGLIHTANTLGAKIGQVFTLIGMIACFYQPFRPSLKICIIGAILPILMMIIINGMQATYILKQMDKHQMDKHQMEKAIKQADNLIKAQPSLNQYEDEIMFASLAGQDKILDLLKHNNVDEFKREVDNLLRREIDNINTLGYDLTNFSPDTQKALIKLTSGKIKAES